MKTRLIAASVVSVCFASSAVHAATSHGSQVDSSDPKASRIDVEGAFKLPPADMFAQTADVQPVNDQIVTSEPVIVDDTGADGTIMVSDADSFGTTRCGLSVVSVSDNAVGDPCATTADVMASLNLSERQIAYVNAHTLSGDAALAH